MASTDIVAARVLATTELLEQILVRCDPGTILAMIRVSRRFKAVIDASLAVQRKLFLQIDPSAPRNNPIPNPLLPHLGAKIDNRHLAAITAHPLPAAFNFFGDEFTDDPPCAPVCVELNVLPKRRGGERMFLTQPPTKLVWIWFFTYGYEQEFCQKAQIRRVGNVEGVRWGDVYERFS